MKQLFNTGWQFTKDAACISPEFLPLQKDTWEAVDLPHTWNGIDGQDGGNDYYRGTCYYAKAVTKADLPQGEEIWLEFEGANASADVYVNGHLATHHDGGYSLFRADITPYLAEENEIVVAVDNSVNDQIYPQMADFTFYGGLYRDVSILGVSKAHFELKENGTPGLHVIPKVDGTAADVTIRAFFAGLEGDEQWQATVMDGEQVVATVTQSAEASTATLRIENVHLWHGRKDPHLYTCKATLLRGETVLDERTTRFGCRTYRIDPDQGFFLNGERYPLHGVCRHQDRPNIGNALKREHHEEDVDIICEIGANTIRLAHYQHNQIFYDLCDERGLVVWAEIPYISAHMPNGRQNTITQMTELIEQNINHASIVVWGLSNEITMRVPDPNDPDLIDNHRVLNELAKRLDPTRPTVLAAVSMCPITADYLKIPDAISYNLYFGWYGGNTAMTGPWLDKFHEVNPTIPIGVAEYGADSLDWHTSNPEAGDYTEEYQAYYHEEHIKQLFSRPYIWATHVWNMFNFAADARSEGGCDGMNNKGLVSFDRKYRKDAFYAYKAWLSDDPFVHLCGKRYMDRVEDVTRVTVYSNQPEVELFANGKSLGTQRAEDHFFRFEVPNVGETTLVAKAGAYEDSGTIRKVATFNMDYVMKEEGDVLNWFEIDAPKGYLSVREKLYSVLGNEDARKLLDEAFVACTGEGLTEKNLKANAMLPIRRIFSKIGPKENAREFLLSLNEKLNQIQKIERM